jgi:RNA polymerase sigma-70 factor, ECF subfamily
MPEPVDVRPLAHTFAQAVGRPLSDEDALAVEERLQALWTQAQAAWRGLTVTPTAFASALGQRVTGPAPLTSLAELHTSDVYLVAACLEGDGAALEVFSQTLLPKACASIQRIELSSGLLRETTQVLRARLLVAPPGAGPTLGTYTGRGPLLHWLRAMAVREALKLRAREQRRVDIEGQALQETSAQRDVELDLVRQLHGHDFAQAFEVAFRALTARERTLLRLHVVDELNIDQLGAFYGTHRTTAFRWLEAAREALALGVRQALAERLGLSGSEVESLLGLVRSQLDVSLRRLLPVSATEGLVPTEK